MIANLRQRPGPWQGFKSSLPSVVTYFGAISILVCLLPQEARDLRPESLVIVGALGIWRWLWMAVHVARSLFYEHWAFPRLREAAMQASECERFPGRVYFLIASYKEQSWISQKVINAIIREARTIPSRVTVIVSTGSDAEDAVFLRVLEKHLDCDRIDLVLMRQSQGKRHALGHALRSVSRRDNGEMSLSIFMDGDTVLGPDVLRRTLPYFAHNDQLGAVTTDEISLTEGARWYRHWYALRFSQRHRMMKSQSLSKRVLSLTGRFSIIRTDLAISESFLAYLEDDHLFVNHHPDRSRSAAGSRPVPIRYRSCFAWRSGLCREY